MPVLSVAAVTERLKSLPGWRTEDPAIVREYAFKDFAAAMLFVNQVAEAAEAANHHPDIDIRYNKIKLLLVSHDAGGLTERDMAMAGQLNEINPAAGPD